MNLQPVDFKAVAAKGAFVYCYLREDGSPFYVGISWGRQRHRRPFAKHEHTSIPTNLKLIRVLKSGLTKQEAGKWEERFIKRYGRKQDGGILDNRATGGEVQKGWTLPNGSHWKGKTRPASTANKTKQVRYIKSASEKGLCPAIWAALTDKERRAVAKRYKDGKRGSDALLSGIGQSIEDVNAAKAVAAAKKYCVPFAFWSALNASQKMRVHQFFSRGKSGAELIAKFPEVIWEPAAA